MAHSTPQDSVQPLTVGNIISAGIELYRAHFQQYFRISLIATLWVLLPFLIVIPAVLFFASVQDYYQALGLLIPAWLVLLIYCIARYSASSAAISRLAFGEITNQPEPPDRASRYTNSRMWSFWFVGFLLFLLYTGIAIGLYILLSIAVVILFASLAGGLAGLQNINPATLAANPTPFVMAFFIFLGLFLIFIALMSWLSARFAIAEVPLAIETESSATKSIGRSWELTNKNAWRILLILFVSFLITTPVQILAWLISSIFDGMLATAIPESSPTFGAVSSLLSYVVGIASGSLLLPMWQSIKAVMYCDLRRRREGMGLQLRDS